MDLTCPAVTWHMTLYGFACIAFALLAVGIGVWRLQRGEAKPGRQRGQVKLEVAQVASVGRLKPERLRYKPMSDLFSYQAEIMPSQERQYPELVKRLRETARRLAADGREITSDDIHEAHPIPAGVDGRVMAAAFHPKKEWLACGWVPSRRKEKNHSRHIRKWRLREAA